jgi:hypothetical protein
MKVLEDWEVRPGNRGYTSFDVDDTQALRRKHICTISGASRDSLSSSSTKLSAILIRDAFT